MPARLNIVRMGAMDNRKARYISNGLNFRNIHYILQHPGIGVQLGVILQSFLPVHTCVQTALAFFAFFLPPVAYAVDDIIVKARRPKNIFFILFSYNYKI